MCTLVIVSSLLFNSEGSLSVNHAYFTLYNEVSLYDSYVYISENTSKYTRTYTRIK